MHSSKIAQVLLAALALSAPASITQAHAAPINLITNGSFTNVTLNGLAANSSISNGGAPGAQINGWSASACQYLCDSGNPNSLFMFIYTGTTSETLESYGSAAPVNYWVVPGASPDGGNGIAEDAANQVGSLSQSLTGLTVGDHYQLQFYQASAQAIDAQANSSFHADWKVGFGSSVGYSATMTNAYQSDTGWTLQTLDFTATATSQLLSFFANSADGGQPPFVLLDGVTLYDIPEPGTVGLIAAGMIGLALSRRQRKA